jgi:hypothetical protein
MSNSVLVATPGIVLLALTTSLSVPNRMTGPVRSNVGSLSVARTSVADKYGQLPLNFEANRGQTDDRVQFLSRTAHQTLFLTPSEAVLLLTGSRPTNGQKGVPATTSTPLAMTFVDANAQPRIRGRAELPGKANYFIGNDPAKWRTNVPTYAKVEYQDLYPGIDLVYYGNHRQLEYDFIVHPGGDPNRIALRFRGGDELAIDPQGDLVLNTVFGAIRQRRPVIYQEANGIRTEIRGGYVLRNGHEIGFQIGAYDTTRPLVVDPTLFYSAYLGGSGNDGGSSIAVDDSGNAYVAGGTTSANFPTSAAVQGSDAGGLDAFIAKINPTGSGLVYSTYLGGSGHDQALGIAIDANGNAYVTGQTNSADFPFTAGAFQTTFGGSGSECSVGAGDAFITKLSATGSALVYSSFLGGSVNDAGFSIALDTSDNAYVTGYTISSDFPTTAGAFQMTLPSGSGCSCSGTPHAFVSKLNASGTSLVYSTFLGDGGQEIGLGIAVDGAGEAYVTGFTNSPNFPTTALSFQSTPSSAAAGCSASDAFVTKLNSVGSALVYSTYLGGSGEDAGFSITLDALGDAYVTGHTASTNFPTAAPFQAASGGGFDAFVTKLNPLGTGLVYSSYLGGSATDEGFGIAVDGMGNAYVTGDTSSSNFPTVMAFQPTLGGVQDAFVTRVNSGGTGLDYSSYLGGSDVDLGTGIALDGLPNPNAYVAGATFSLNFPTTAGAFQMAFGGGQDDAFVTKVTNIALPPPPTVGKVTGGGSINVTNGIGTFGFIVQRQAADQSIQGDLQYVNHASGANIHSVMFTSFAITGNTSTFGGACTNNGAPCTFTVNVSDNDDPSGPDSFTISVDNGPTQGGTLRSGSIEIHQ